MKDLHKETNQLLKEEYNKIPVFYCTECGSLAIMKLADTEDSCYCDKCGCTDIKETTIEEWENSYKKK